LSNETSLAVRRQITPDVFQMVEAIAPVMWQSRFFGVSSKEQAAAVMIKGFELGLPLAASFEFIHIVEGKPTLSPRGALALIYTSGELVGLKIEDKPDACTVWMKRKNGVEFTATWTMDDARRAGLVKDRGAWAMYPANMLRWRAIGFCADVVFPDLLGGLKRADEFDAPIDDRGNVIEGEWSVTAAAPDVPAIPPTLDQLVERYGVERVLEANGGTIPGTDEELAAVAGKLAG
jgi:hypothetical protein